MLVRVTNPETAANKPGIDPYIVSLDIGSSSVRSLLFDGRANQLDHFGKQVKYDPRTTDGGGVEFDPEELFGHCRDVLDALHKQLQDAGIQPKGVGISAFWHSFLGVGKDRKAISPLFHLLDTRSKDQAAKLRKTLDPKAVHARTGCVIHTSYWPSKLLWLSETRGDLWNVVERWMSFPEYLFLRLFNKPTPSSSMMSGTGLWNQNANRYDDELLSALPVDKAKLPLLDELDQPCQGLVPEFAEAWPVFKDIPWFPAYGDGACNNVGSGCVTPERFSLMVGTTGAMRAVTPADKVEIPPGLWCYRVDAKRFVLGGALSDGGKVFEWMSETLRLPEGDDLEKQLGEMTPGAHGLTMLPLFAGERSPGWRDDARAAITGLALHTRPIDILRASLEGVALRFRLIYDLMVSQLAPPKQVIGSGGALLKSQVWTRMMADALNHSVTTCLEKEASARGAALLALERIGAIKSLDEIPSDMGETFEPSPEHQAAYDKMQLNSQGLYKELFKENSTNS